MCKNIEYVDNLLKDIQTCLKQTIIWAAIFVLMCSIYCYLSKICKLEKRVNLLNIWLKTSTTGFCLQVFYYRYSFKSFLKFVSFVSRSLLLFGKWTKSVIGGQLYNDIIDYIPMIIDKVIVLIAILITTATLVLLKNVWKRRQVRWKRSIRKNSMKAETKNISLFDISAASLDCDVLNLKNQMILAGQRQSSVNSKGQPKLLANIFATVFMDFIYSQVMLLCRSVARKHDLNDSESMLLRWTCFSITNTLYEAKGNLSQSSHKIDTLLKLGSMLNCNSKTFRLLGNSKGINSVDVGEQDIFFNIFFEEDHIILRSKVFDIPSITCSDDRLTLNHSRHFPLPQRLQRRLTDYKVMSFYGSAQRINEAIKDFEKKAVQFLKGPFIIEDKPNKRSELQKITITKFSEVATLLKRPLAQNNTENILEWKPVQADVKESFLQNRNSKHLLNNITYLLQGERERESRKQVSRVNLKKKPDFRESFSDLRAKIEHMRNK
ncbi:Hypothetical predicted protein [Octopus vulgaris]|uniref:Uncharacterized protein n=1 Tax=Octopus vulgaris TaxID=6645 RepID=A0AA36BMI2_OCTVU|nr:Hypothetical predicted protein [Octopus vulgaris]